MSIKAPRETQLVSACLELLGLARVLCWRQNTGAANNGPRFVRFGLRGIADILGLLPGGQFFAVECKSARGRLSAEQQAFLDNVTAAGGAALVVRDVRELDTWLRARGLLE